MGRTLGGGKQARCAQRRRTERLPCNDLGLQRCKQECVCMGKPSMQLARGSVGSQGCCHGVRLLISSALRPVHMHAHMHSCIQCMRARLHSRLHACPLPPETEAMAAEAPLLTCRSRGGHGCSRGYCPHWPQLQSMTWTDDALPPHDAGLLRCLNAPTAAALQAQGGRGRRAQQCTCTAARRGRRVADVQAPWQMDCSIHSRGIHPCRMQGNGAVKRPILRHAAAALLPCNSHPRIRITAHQPLCMRAHSCSAPFPQI